MITMVGNLGKYASYWKFALADSQLGKGTFSAAHMRALEGRTIELEALKRQSLVSEEAWLAGETPKNALSLDEVRRWARSEDTPIPWLRMVVYPFVYLLQASHQHGYKRNFFIPEMIAPVSFTVLVNADGQIKAHGRPGIARELLEPAKGARSIVIGSVDTMDAFYDENPFPDYYDNPDEDRLPISDVLDYCNRLLDCVCEVELSAPSGVDEARYTLTHHAMIHKARQTEASNRPLMEVYDAILRQKPKLTLLPGILKDNRQEVETPTPQARTMSLRSGSMHTSMEMGEDQRQSVGAALSIDTGQALAVNGPPGTGKTTMIQAVVASLIVNAARARKDPPIIVVASTNNQAVTNVLGSLEWGQSDSPLYQRWIDGWDSFGLYLPSFSKRERSEERGLPTRERFDLFESRVSIDHAKMRYVERVGAVLGKTPEDVIAAAEAVHDKLNQEARILGLVEELQAGFESVRRIGQLKALHQKLVIFQKECAGIIPESELGRVVGELSSMLQEMASLFKQAQAAADVFKKQNRKRSEARHSVHPLLRKLSHLPIINVLYLRQYHAALERVGLPKHINPASAQRGLQVSQGEFGRAIRAIGTGPRWDGILAKLDNLMDRYVRPRLFAWATHWYEAQWIIEVGETVRAGDSDKRTKIKVERMLRRRSKLAPCIVATFHTLPKHLNYWEHRTQREVPLFEIVDWLINDEAGQCAPEVAGATLALAKRLIAVGDCWQIEPIWNIEPHVDMGNLVSAEIVTADELEHQLDALEFTGRLASSGSTMKMAQAATRFGTPGAGQPGLTLTSHRRCLPDIIQYCNELCYEGVLRPLRQDAKTTPLPAMGYLHVPGVAERVRGSRSNAIEASIIAGWINEHSEMLQDHYESRALGDIVAIITPFKEQARTIRDRLQLRLGSGADDITVGTIHALQGAERPIVIFSPTYSSHQSASLFFDASPMMLNVAVSRAKDSFLVIGDLDVLKNGQKPSRLLYDHLTFTGRPVDWNWDPTDLVDDARHAWGEDIIKSLKGHDEHQQALQAILSRGDVRHLTLVSPLISMDGLRRYADDLVKAARAGRRVQIVVSKRLNTQGDQGAMFGKACELLEQQGVTIVTAEHLTWSAMFADDQAFAYGQGSWLGENGDVEQECRSWLIYGDASASEWKRCLGASGIDLE